MAYNLSKSPTILNIMTQNIFHKILSQNRPNVTLNENRIVQKENGMKFINHSAN